MRTHFKSIFIGLVCKALSIMLTSQLWAEQSYKIILDNFEQVSESEFQIDVLLENQGRPFYINDVQVEVIFNPEIKGQGEFITGSGLNVVEGSSDLLYPPAFNDISLAHDGNRFILVSEEPAIGQTLQTVGENEILRIARIQASLYYEDKRAVFANTTSDFEIDTHATMVLYSTIDGQDTKKDIGRRLKGRQLINNIDNLQLASHVFYGPGNWHEYGDNGYINWNAHPETHPDFAYKLPGENSNIIIIDNALIEEGKTVTLDKGYILLKNDYPNQYSIELIGNGNNVSVEIFHIVDQNEIPIANPSLIEPGESLIFLTDRGFASGTFINWTDQHGNILSTEPEFGPYIMPAENMVITANWSSGSKSNNKESIGYSQLPGLVIEAGAGLSAEAIYNEHDAGASAVVLMAGQNGLAPASLIHNNHELEATIEQYLCATSGWKDNSPYWHWISTPVEGQCIEDFLLSGSVGQEYELYRWCEASDTWLNYKNHEGQFDHSEFIPGTGYLFAAPVGATYTYTGALRSEDKIWEDLGIEGAGNMEDENEAYRYEPGWHLLGNPFSSGILIYGNGDNVWTGENIELTPQRWDEDAGSYDIFPDDFIPVATSFFIKVINPEEPKAYKTTGNVETTTKRVYTNKENNSVKGSLMIPAGARIHQPETETKTATQRITLEAGAWGGNTLQRTHIAVKPNPTFIHDNRYDASFRPGNAPLFYSLKGSKRLLQQSVDIIDNNLVIPLYFKAREGKSTHHISLTGNLPETDVYLYDLKADSLHYMNEGPYLFTSKEENRERDFELRFGKEDIVTAYSAHFREEQNLLDGIQIFTNQNKLYVRFPVLTENARIEVKDIQGRVAGAWNMRQSIEFSRMIDFRPGVYVISIYTEGKNYSEKLLIE